MAYQHNTKSRDYKSKITYHQNRLNNAINCSANDLDPKETLKALESLTYFVKQQIEVQQPQYKKVLESKLKYIQSLQLDIEDYDFESTKHYPAFIQFNGDEGTYEIEFDEFDIGDSIETIQNGANLYSCCGDILDRDYMICPTCKEHC